MAKTATPGDRLFPAATHSSGEGTYLQDEYVVSLLAGSISTEVSGDQKPVVSVIRKGSKPAYPKPGSIVTVKVARVSARAANVDILCVGNRPIEAFSGIIRSTDVRATEVDKVEVLSCFRPGDVVRAEVLSVGDHRSFFLTTARNDLGVVFAKSIAGVPLVPISWVEMQCPQTKSVEKRKVAKVTV